MESSGQERTFSTGSVRDGGKKPALQLISPHAMMRLGEWLRFAVEDRKPHPYPERNWEKGQPFSQVIASLQRHVEKFKLGDRSEDHVAAILFGGMALAHYEEEIKAGRLDAELDDMPHYATRMPLVPPATIQKIQAKLDQTFGDPRTIYAVGDIRLGDTFYICRGRASMDPGKLPSGPGCTGHAVEAIPDGAPMRIAKDCPPNESMWEVALGTTRIGPNGRETYMKRVPPPETIPPATLNCPGCGVSPGERHIGDCFVMAKARNTRYTLGVDLASGPGYTATQILQGDQQRVDAATDGDCVEVADPAVHCSGCGSGDKDWHLNGCPVSAAGVNLSPRRARTILESLEERVASGELLNDQENTVLCRLRDQQRVDTAPDGAVVLVTDPAALLDPKLWTVPFTVYLCGPITGQEVDYTWRAAATAMLQAHGIRTLDPLRGKHRDQISGLGLSYKGQLAAPEIADRDQMDVQEADVILAHFPYDPPRQSIGSLMEMGAAAIGYGKPVVLCTEVKVFNDHLFCRNFCTLEPDFEQALNRIVAMATARRR